MTHVSKISSVAFLLIAGLSASANAGGMDHYCPPKVIQPAATHRVTHTVAAPQVVYKQVQTTPEYRVQRPEVVSGTRVTVFANFLRNEKGYVFFDVSDTTVECKVLDWRPDAVTFELPKLGLARNLDAKIRVVVPNGRIAKRISVVLVPQPVIVIHEETIPQPMPPAASSNGSGVYAGSVEASFAE